MTTKERPILFSAPMVRAILDGSKTQTRRVMKHQPHDEWYPAHYTELHAFDKDGELNPDKVVGWGAVNEDGDQGYVCPYGQPGDRLWVRETFALDDNGHNEWPVFRADGAALPVLPSTRKPARWVPSIHMPRWASRILLEIVSVRVERLQEISEDDARSEGIREVRQWARGGGLPVFAHAEGDGIEDHTDPRDAYRALWNDINGAEAWDANPWVWVVEFKRVAPCK